MPVRRRASSPYGANWPSLLSVLTLLSDCLLPLAHAMRLSFRRNRVIGRLRSKSSSVSHSSPKPPQEWVILPARSGHFIIVLILHVIHAQNSHNHDSEG